MAITDIPGLAALRTSMQWHQQRQRLLAENVSNADTPNYQPRDLVRPSAEALAAGVKPGVTMARTSPMHIGFATGDSTGFALERKSASETRPSGNAVNLDEEMLKVASNQMDYQAATSLYTRSLGLLKTAIGRR
jgi:flagellar basal-body rod protein FlgB